MRKLGKFVGLFGLFAAVLTLSGCEWGILSPAGYIAKQELVLIVICVAVMLCIVIPVMIAVIVFAIKYRASNKSAEYMPDWGHSNKVEAFMWGIPVLVVIVLAAMTAYYTHLIDPWQPIDGEHTNKEAPIQIDAIALDWKWLFIYPDYKVASINEIYAPVNHQVLLQLSAESSVNAFWVPRLGTVLYAMPQMNAKLHLVANEEGVFAGSSANYSGDGFATMTFKWHSVSEAQFAEWIAKARSSEKVLDATEYSKLRIPLAMREDVDPNNLPDVVERRDANLEDAKVRYYSNVEGDLYYRAVNRCVGLPDKACNQQLMIDAASKTLWGELCSVLEPSLLKK